MVRKRVIANARYEHIIINAIYKIYETNYILVTSLQV